MSAAHLIKPAENKSSVLSFMNKERKQTEADLHGQQALSCAHSGALALVASTAGNGKTPFRLDQEGICRKILKSQTLAITSSYCF